MFERCRLLLLSLALTVFGTAAGAAPLRGELPPVEGEVIVRFKPGAAVVRQHALASQAGEPTVRSVLAARTAALATRTGRPLQSGAAVGERMQVMRDAGLGAAELARRLAADPDVEFAVPNGRVRRLVAPNDPLYGPAPAVVRPRGPETGQWYLRAPTAAAPAGIDIEAAWARTTGSAGIVVAVLDTGVRSDHPDLAGRLVAGYDFISNAAVANDGNGRDADPSDPGDWVTSADTAGSTFNDCTVESSSWHGTKTASLIGAAKDDGVGMAGAAPDVRVQPVRVLGKCFGTDSDIQAAMRWAAGIHVDGVPDNPTPAKVLNLSLGGSGACSAGYQAAVNEIVARGVVIVAAAGNSAGHPVGTPANCNGVIAVLALRHAGTKVGFSDLGPQIALGAPGGNCVNTAAGTPCQYPILAATNTGTTVPLASGWTDSYNITVGTSFAAPLVSATAALMLSAQPSLTPAQVRSKLQASARAYPTSGADNGPSDPTAVTQCQAPSSNVDQLQCYCNTTYCGAGMLDAGAAVTAAAAGTLARIDTTTAAPVANSPLTLSAASSLPPSGGTITGYDWAIVDGGGIATAFSSATNASTATLTPTGAGSFTVRLTLTDSNGGTSTALQTVAVAAAPVVTPPTNGSGSGSGGGGSGGGGGGGGALSLPWLVLLGAAVGRLVVQRQRR